jgi:hypothetical protein
MVRLKNITIHGSKKLEFHWLISLEPVIAKNGSKILEVFGADFIKFNV